MNWLSVDIYFYILNVIFLLKFCLDIPNILEIWSLWSFFFFGVFFNLLPNVTRLNCFIVFSLN